MLTQAVNGFPPQQELEKQLDRRRFLKAGGAALLAAACGRTLATSWEEAAVALPTMLPSQIADLSPGTARAVRLGDGEALAVRLDDGELVAFDRRCPHLGCPVVWSAERQRIECPCHHAAFDARSGEVLFGPPRRGLTPVAVQA